MRNNNKSTLVTIHSQHYLYTHNAEHQKYKITPIQSFHPMREPNPYEINDKCVTIEKVGPKIKEDSGSGQHLNWILKLESTKWSTMR